MDADPGRRGGGAAADGPPSRAEAEAFLYREARLLDERRFEEWLGLFAADGRYFIPGGESDEPVVEPAIVDDDRPTLEDRVHRLRSPVTFAQVPPSRTLHLVGNVEVGPAVAPGEWRLHASCIVHEARAGETRSFAGRFSYVLRRTEGGAEPWRIAEKRVRLLNYDHPLYNLTFLL